MRLSLRFLVPLLLAVGAFAYVAVPLSDALMLRWFVRDLDIRSSLIATTVQEPLSDLAVAGSRSRITSYFDRMLRDERLYAIGLCRAGQAEPIATSNFPRELGCAGLSLFAGDRLPLLHSARGLLHVAVRPVNAEEPHGAQLVLVHDMSFVERRNEETRRYLFYFFLALGACSGTWIAHGSGSADRETVDCNDRVAVPPAKPAYSIRRIWLSKEEEEAGYYAGFANEGLWPLCHIAHVRPTFRSSDWEYYRTVNARFADAVVAEAKTKDPVVLVQDYHFALLPRLIRKRLPEATILTFWHIPWPNPEEEVDR